MLLIRVKQKNKSSPFKILIIFSYKSEISLQIRVWNVCTIQITVRGGYCKWDSSAPFFQHHLEPATRLIIVCGYYINRHLTINVNSNTDTNVHVYAI